MDEKIESLAVSRLRWLNSIKEGDAIAIVFFLEPEARIFLPDDILIKNLNNICEWVKFYFEYYKCDWNLSQVNRQVTNDCAVENGKFTLTVSAKNGNETLQFQCKYIVLWEMNKEMNWRITTVFIQYDNDSEFTSKSYLLAKKV